MIAGRQFWLWRAVDGEGEVLDLLVQPRRDKAAAVKLMRKLLKKQGFAPDVLVTDKLRSYNKRPPRHTQFKPGVSGNPKGRRKGSVNLRTRVQRRLRKTVVVNKNGRPTRMVIADVISDRLLELSMKGDLRSIQYVVQSDEDTPASEAANHVEAGDGDLPDKDSLRLIVRRLRDLVDEDE